MNIISKTFDNSYLMCYTENIKFKEVHIMPRGRKKSLSDNILSPNPETSAEFAPAPAEIAESAAEKIPAKKGRKPRNDKKKSAAVTAAENSIKAETDPEATVIGDDKTNKTSAKEVRKTRSDKITSKSKVVTSVADPAPAEKKKRSSNKKTNKAEEFIIQSSGNEYTMSDITEMCKNAYRDGTRKQIKSIRVYVKSENNGIRAYYVINDNISNYIDL